ncbi:carbohydrate esterase family 8 protein [Mollisia scopiformis]|uniref:pectinesterase n=1 Tax=Mollisia scopiformis TaxID=149040 RepID=A0A194XPR0_MOLSC|nr:carbohydrate esterase family 8 protein [Mollisia scopiformis]KUJ22240.1 carbohydrate esterase family 8 protein [Mollisia scopiformis]
MYLRRSLGYLLTSTFFLANLAHANNSTSAYVACQAVTVNPLDGCPSNTVLVSQTDCSANFSTIQSAVLSIPNNTIPYTILVLPGNYIEQINVTRSGPLTILGQTNSPNDQSENSVTVYWTSADANSDLPGDAFSSVLTVAPNLNASLTGSGPTGFAVPADTPFGCTDFRVYNIDFRNVYSEISAGPALAVSVSRANAGFYYSGIYSYQDTVYVGKLGNAYFYHNEIAGQTDFFYGFGTAWIESTSVLLRGCGGGITAWKGTNTTFVNKYGVYISDSTLNAANSSIAPSMVGKCFLGRPWNALMRAVYLNMYMDASIAPAGFKKWTTDPATDNYGPNTTMAEYKSYGPGFNLTTRIAGNLTIEFTADQARAYRTPKDVFMASDGSQSYYSWIDAAYYPW